MRWAAWLAEFDFKIKYVPGKENGAADALSRGAAGSGRDEQSNTQAGTEGPQLLLNAILELAPLPVRVRDAAARDVNYEEQLQQTNAEFQKSGFNKSGGLLYRVDGTPGGGQLVIPKEPRLRTYLLAAAHDTLGAHQGRDRTLRWLQERVWWQGMSADVDAYVRGCEVCQRSKPDTRGKMGLPLSIETPKRAWETVCMDFIGPLKRTVRGHDAILVAVDKLTRYVYYVPCSTRSTAPDVFRLLNERVLANHGYPANIVSDRDTRFTSRFWEDLWEHLGTALKRSTAFHPQTDGQTEVQNKTLIMALTACVDAAQGDWDLLLPEIQFAHNTAISASTGFSPHQMLYGRTARTALDAELESDGVAVRGVHPGAKELAQRVQDTERKARERISKAQEKQRKDALGGRRPVDFAVGDRVWLSNRNMQLDLGDRARKLEPRFFGPYEVLEMHGSNAAKLQLPAGCKLHPVFNADLLRKYVDGRVEFPDRPIRDARPGPVPEEDPEAGGPASGMPQWEVECILQKRRRGGTTQYRVKWQGWPIEQASWVDEDQCEGCRDLIAAFEASREEVNALQLRLAAVRAETRRVRRQLDSREQQQPQPQYGPPTREEAARERARQAEEDTKPLLPDQVRPPAGPDGQINMGTQRCIAQTKAGGQCKQPTRHGAHCWVHLMQKFGVRIKTSTIPGAGKGLHAARDFKKGDVVARYTGDLLPVKAPDGSENRGQYMVLLSEVGTGAVIDAARTNSAEGRMLCSAAGSGRRNNCRFSADQRSKTMKLRATRNIKKGEELLVNYGPDFDLAPAVQAQHQPQTGRKGAPEKGDSKQHPIVLSVLTSNRFEALAQKADAA